MTPGAVARITVRPSGIQFEIAPGEAVMAAAERHGHTWPTTCHGMAECRTCVMYVIESDLSLVDQPSALERDALASATFSLQGERERWRLACQTTVQGDVAVRKPGVH